MLIENSIAQINASYIYKFKKILFHDDIRALKNINSACKLLMLNNMLTNIYA
jgi:hypothetical protein